MLGLLLALFPAGGADCKACKGDGLADCPALERHACPADSRARQCSVAAACPQCAGTAVVPCPRCKHAPGPEYAEQRVQNGAWLQEVRRVDATMGKELVHADSAHFRLTWNVRRLEAKGTRTPHDGLHLYLSRLEELFERFGRDLGARPEDFLDRTHVLVWDRKEDQEQASLAYTRQSSSSESKLMGKSPVVSIFYDREFLHEEFELHQALVHQVTHCLLSNVWDGIWPGNVHAGWLDEGLAHAYEIDLFGGVRHYCVVESDTLFDFQFGAWESHVRLAVERDQAPSFLSVAGKNTVELTTVEQPCAWSYVDYLLREAPATLGPLARALKARQPLREALAETIGCTPFEFEERWKAYVRARYELKKPR
jgi:hypothetical protein